jgi:U3 small nucleolar RNA-associated protein 20
VRAAGAAPERKLRWCFTCIVLFVPLIFFFSSRCSAPDARAPPASRAGAPGSARAAILNFLAAAEPLELRTLLHLFLAPLGAVFVQPDAVATAGLLEGPSASTLAAAAAAAAGEEGGPWWARALGRRPGAFWLAAIDAGALNAQPLRRRIGYLNTLEDLLRHLGHKMEAYLPELLAVTIVLLEGATAGLGAAGAAAAAGGAPPPGDAAGEGAKEVRGRCLRLVAATLQRFPAAADYNFAWPRLLAASAPLMERLAAEVAADRAPPLVELLAALADSQQLAPVLGDARSGAGAGAPPPAAAPRAGEPWAAREALGSRLLARCVGALASAQCSEPARAAVLGALERLFDLPDPLAEQLLGGHTPALLSGMQAIVVAVWRGAGGTKGRGRPSAQAPSRGKGVPPGGAPRRATAARALAVLELVGGRATSWETAAQLTDALLPLLAPQSGRGKRRADEELLARALGALAALWSRLGGAAAGAGAGAGVGPEQERRAQAERAAAALAPLAGSLETRDAREALCAAFSALGRLLPEVEGSAALLAGLNAASTSSIDDVDYEARTAAYAQLTPAAWAALSPLAAPPLLQHAARDLRNGDDLALRHAAAQALGHFVAAAAEGARGGGAAAAAAAAEAASPPLALARRLLFPQLKRGLGASSLAVRQEHLALLRALVLALPAHYPDLTPLTHQDPETDFLTNVAHLQLHRRAR